MLNFVESLRYVKEGTRYFLNKTIVKRLIYVMS